MVGWSVNHPLESPLHPLRASSLPKNRSVCIKQYLINLARSFFMIKVIFHNVTFDKEGGDYCCLAKNKLYPHHPTNIITANCSDDYFRFSRVTKIVFNSCALCNINVVAAAVDADNTIAAFSAP